MGANKIPVKKWLIVPVSHTCKGAEGLLFPVLLVSIVPNTGITYFLEAKSRLHRKSKAVISDVPIIPHTDDLNKNSVVLIYSTFSAISGNVSCLRISALTCSLNNTIIACGGTIIFSSGSTCLFACSSRFSS